MTLWQSVLVRLLTGVKGAEEAIEAIRAGDYAGKVTWLARRRICRACTTWRGAFCGTPFVNVPGVSCGCCCFAATAVASKACPQKKYLAVTIMGKTNP